MALSDIIQRKTVKKEDISEERIKAILPVFRQYVALWREYPDLFVDYLLSLGNPNDFHLYYYQRVFLRMSARYRYMYATFTRAYSKSFLANLVNMIRGVLYPRCKLFCTAGGKEQKTALPIREFRKNKFFELREPLFLAS